MADSEPTPHLPAPPERTADAGRTPPQSAAPERKSRTRWLYVIAAVIGIATVTVIIAAAVGVLSVGGGGSSQPTETPLSVADSPKSLSNAAVDAAANFVAVMAFKQDTPEMGRRYDELAKWLNGNSSLTAARVQADIEMICSAPSAQCKSH